MSKSEIPLATIDVSDEFGKRTLVVPSHEVTSDVGLDGLAEYVLYIEFATGTRLRDGQNPVWFTRAFRGLCAEMGNDEAADQFASFCDDFHCDEVEITTHRRVTGNTIDEYRSETLDDPIVHAITFCDAAWSCWTLARRFRSNYSMPPGCSRGESDETGRLVSGLFANRQMEFVTVSHVRLESAIERWHQLMPYDILDVIKDVRSANLLPIRVGDETFTTAHEASVAFAEKVSKAWTGARGTDAVSILTDLARRLEPLECQDLHALIEIESVAARREYSTTAENEPTPDHSVVASVNPVPRMLNRKQQRALDFIARRGPVKGVIVARELGIKESTFRSHYLPILVKHGVQNVGEGYFLPFRQSAT